MWIGDDTMWPPSLKLICIYMYIYIYINVYKYIFINTYIYIVNRYIVNRYTYIYIHHIDYIVICISSAVIIGVMSNNLANYGAPHCRRLFMAGHCRYTTDSSTKTSGLRRRAADASAGGSRAGIFPRVNLYIDV